MTSFANSDSAAVLPIDGCTGTLIGRAWVPGSVPGPAVIAVRADGVFDLSKHFCTVASLLAQDDPAAAAARVVGQRVGSLAQIVANTFQDERDLALPWLLAPCDLQVIKAAGVTFITSLLERVIEERALGDAAGALEVRARVEALIGPDLAVVRPGSAQAQRLKELLIEQGIWSQYLEVGIGPDAEVFTKAPMLAAVGTGVEVGIHSESKWNNPEPEVVLAVNPRGRIVGATLGNDVNLRDFEGRSALLLGKAKDNNASCAIGPFLRLFDASFSLDDVRAEELELTVTGPDGYTLRGASSMARISRDPQDLVEQTCGANHQYPDGFMLFLGTLFAPVQDRDVPGSGFTHRVGDVVTIRSPRLGALCNRVNHADRVTPWTFGVRALIANLAARGLLADGEI